MWRLFSKLFGWEYAAVDYGNHINIRRVYKSKKGDRFVLIHGNVIFLEKGRFFKPLTYVED